MLAWKGRGYLIDAFMHESSCVWGGVSGGIKVSIYCFAAVE